jgi:hypothetical protein
MSLAWSGALEVCHPPRSNVPATSRCHIGPTKGATLANPARKIGNVTAILAQKLRTKKETPRGSSRHPSRLDPCLLDGFTRLRRNEA